MNLAVALGRLKDVGQPTLTTSDVMAVFEIPKSHASKMLSRLATAGHVLRVKRGTWAFAENADPLMLVDSLTAPLPSYVSLQTALYHHGMISQVPHTTYCVSLSRTRIYRTAVGSISVHHIQPSFFIGFEEIGRKRIKMACPEKALLDFLYLGAARSGLFASLPELELPKAFSRQKAWRMMNLIASASRRSMVSTRLNKLLAR